MVTITPLPTFVSESTPGPNVYPRPINYGYDGRVALTLKITSAAAEDLDVLEMAGDSVITGPVTLTAGDEAQSCLDIAAAVESGFQARTYSNMVAFSRDNAWRGHDPFPPETTVISFSGAATTYEVCATPFVIEVFEDRFLMKDAARPRLTPLGEFDTDADPCRTDIPYAISADTWIWIPELKSAHRLVHLTRLNELATFLQEASPLTWVLELDPVPVLNSGEFYAILPIPRPPCCVTVTNVGGLPAIVDGQPFAPGMEAELEFESRYLPLTYDPNGSILQFTFQR